MEITVWNYFVLAFFSQSAQTPGGSPKVAALLLLSSNTMAWMHDFSLDDFRVFSLSLIIPSLITMF